MPECPERFVSTYFFGRVSTPEHRLQRFKSELTLAPHLPQRRAFTALTNAERGRNLPIVFGPFVGQRHLRVVPVTLLK